MSEESALRYASYLSYLDMLNMPIAYDLDMLLRALGLLNDEEIVTDIIIKNNIPVGFELSTTNEIISVSKEEVKEKSENVKCDSLPIKNRMSSKNEVQRMCHKLKLELPAYTLTSHLVNTDNSHTFTSTCVIETEDGDTFETRGVGRNKKRSEMAAAEHMIQKLREYEEIVYGGKYLYGEYDFEKTEDNVIYFIDIENCPWAFNDNVWWSARDRIYTFMSTYSHHYRQKEKYERLSKVMAVDSHGSNAADIYMTYFVGQLSSEHERHGSTPTFVFISSDKFVGTLNDVMRSTNIDSVVVTNLNDLHTLLQQSKN